MESCCLDISSDKSSWRFVMFKTFAWMSSDCLLIRAVSLIISSDIFCTFSANVLRFTISAISWLSISEMSFSCILSEVARSSWRLLMLSMFICACLISEAIWSVKFIWKRLTRLTFFIISSCCFVMLFNFWWTSIKLLLSMFLSFLSWTKDVVRARTVSLTVVRFACCASPANYLINMYGVNVSIKKDTQNKPEA